MEKIAGLHYAPSVSVWEDVDGRPWTKTLHVCVCLVLIDSQGNQKLGKTAVRVIGGNTPDGVYLINLLSEIVALQLDEGIYVGPKRLVVSSYEAGLLYAEFLSATN